MKWKVGDRIVIARRDSLWWPGGMDCLLGLSATIHSTRNGIYYISIDSLEGFRDMNWKDFSYDGTGFDPLSDEDKKMTYEVGDKVFVVNTGREMRAKKSLIPYENVVCSVVKVGEEGISGLLHILNPVNNFTWWMGDECVIPASDEDSVVNEIPMELQVQEEALPQVLEKPKTFKKGQKLICIDNTGKRYLTIGKLYDCVDGNVESVNVTNDAGIVGKYFLFHFEKATTAIIAKIAKDKADAEAAVKKAKADAEAAVKKAKEEEEAKRHLDKEAALIKAKKESFFEERMELRKKAELRPALTSYYSIVGETSSSVMPNTACHAFIGLFCGSSRITLIEDVNIHTVGRDDEWIAKYKRWVDYVVNQGPRSNCFVKQGVVNAFKYGIVYNGDRPINELAGAAVQLREGAEYSDRLTNFCKLLDEGFSGNVAYLLCYAVNSQMTYTGFDSVHKSMSNDLCYEGVFRFFREGYYRTAGQRPFRGSTGSYDGIAQWIAIKTKEDKTIDAYFRKALNIIKAADVWNGKSPKVEWEDVILLAELLEPLVNKF